MLLNVRMLFASGELRLQIEANFWIEQGSPEALESLRTANCCT